MNLKYNFNKNNNQHFLSHNFPWYLAQSTFGIIIIVVSTEINLGFQGAATKHSNELNQYKVATWLGIEPTTSRSCGRHCTTALPF
jgi:hypothetical protein